MSQASLCQHCQQLVRTKNLPVSSRFSLVNRIYNHTVYNCRECGAYFGHTHVPFRWQLMLAPAKRYPAPAGNRPSPRIQAQLAS